MSHEWGIARRVITPGLAREKFRETDIELPR